MNRAQFIHQICLREVAFLPRILQTRKTKEGRLLNEQQNEKMNQNNKTHKAERKPKHKKPEHMINVNKLITHYQSIKTETLLLF